MFLFIFTGMQADKELIAKLGNLAKLEFNPEEEKQISNDLTNMIAFIDRLKEVDVSGIEPLVYVNEMQNVLREDIVQMEITKQDALKNAPLADSDYFKVPKVLKKK